MKRVTTERFITLVQERLDRGLPYVVASEGLQTEEEVQRSFREITEGDLKTDRRPYGDEPADGLEVGAETVLEWAESMGGAAKYDAVGWTPPPDDPEYELMLKVEAIMDEARNFRLHDAIRDLSKQEQAVIHAMFWDGTAQADIARGLGISRQAVHSAYSRSLDKLREAFGLAAETPATKRLTQGEMDEVVLARQRRRGRGVDARLARLRAAGLA